MFDRLLQNLSPNLLILINLIGDCMLTQGGGYNAQGMWKHIRNAIGWEGLSFVTLASFAFGFLFANKFLPAKVCFWLAAASLILRFGAYAWKEFGEIRIWTSLIFSLFIICIQVFIVIPWIDREKIEVERAAKVTSPEIHITRGEDHPPGTLKPPGNAKDKPRQPHKQQSTLPSREKPPTLSDLFKQDFANTLRAGDDLTLTREADGALIHIKRQVYMDFDAKTDFVGFYISSSDQFSDETFRICKTLVDAVQPAILDLTARKRQFWGGYRDQGNTSKELVFSGRVFLYYEGLLSITQKADLIESYKAKNYDVQFRGLDYAADQAAAWYREHGFPKPDAKQP